MKTSPDRVDLTRPNLVQHTASPTLNVAALASARRSSLQDGVLYYFFTLFPTDDCPAGLATEYTAVTVLEFALSYLQEHCGSRSLRSGIQTCLDAFNRGRPLVSDTEYMKSGQKHFHLVFLCPPLTRDCLKLLSDGIRESNLMRLAKMHEGVSDTYALGLNRNEASRTILDGDGNWRLGELCSAITYTRKEEKRRKSITLVQPSGELISCIDLSDKQFRAVLNGVNGARVSFGDLGLYTYRHNADSDKPHRLVPRNGIQGPFADKKHRAALFSFMKECGLSLETSNRHTDSPLWHLFSRLDSKTNIRRIDNRVRLQAYSVQYGLNLHGYTFRRVISAMSARLGVSEQSLAESSAFGSFVRQCCRQLGVGYAQSGYCDPVLIVAAYVTRILVPEMLAAQARRKGEDAMARRPRHSSSSPRHTSLHHKTPPKNAP